MNATIVMTTTGSVNDTGVTIGNLENYSIEELNDEYALSKLGGMIFVGILMFFGIIGNAHVLGIYAFKFKRSNHRLYILSLASMDIVTCCIGMPFVIVDLRYPLLFTIVPICKILRFLNYFMCAGSALILVVIAVDRYKKICQPFKPQMSNKTAKIACLTAITVSLCLSWPAPILYGHSTVSAKTISEYFKTEINITGVQCFTEDRFKKTKYQAYFNIVLVFVILSTTVILATLYGLIGKKVYKQTSKFSRKIKVAPLGGQADSSSSKTESSAASNIQLISNRPIIADSRKSVSVTSNSRMRTGVENTSAIGKSERNEAQKIKVTLMLFIITLVFVLSFMPHLSLKIVAFLKKDFLPKLNFTELFLYNTFVWSFFINNIANPIIYGFCDSRFRMEMKKLYRPCTKSDEMIL